MRLSFASDPVVANATCVFGIGETAFNFSASSSTTGTVRCTADGYIGIVFNCRVAASTNSGSLYPSATQ
jgi:hypothetical protein